MPPFATEKLVAVSEIDGLVTVTVAVPDEERNDPPEASVPPPPKVAVIVSVPIGKAAIATA